MNFTKITEEDLLDKGVFGLPDTPGLTTQQMQEKFDELSKDVIIPKLNSLIDELEPLKKIEKVSDTVEDSNESIPTGKAVTELVKQNNSEFAKKPVYKSEGGFPDTGDYLSIYIDDTVSPRLLYTWDNEEGYVLTGGSSSGGAVLLEISTDGYNELPEVEKMRDDVQYFISSGYEAGIIKYKNESYGGGDIDYTKLEFDTEEIVVENPMEDESKINGKLVAANFVNGYYTFEDSSIKSNSIVIVTRYVAINNYSSLIFGVHAQNGSVFIAAYSGNAAYSGSADIYITWINL